MRNNLAALRLLRELQERSGPATADEQKVLARWSGWGAVPQVFDNDNPDFAIERAELRELLSITEYRAAARTTLNAHYTDAALVSAIWDGMRELGFSGGNVLEPGCGSGNFIGFAPTDTPVPTRMIGVELDPITAGIAAHLYPEPHAQILNESFGDTLIPVGEMDAAVGNVPFGDYRVYDPAHNPDRFSIHNHFINKSLDAVRPGGVVAMITSRFTMDSEGSEARAALASKADLLGAIRLPASAHQDAAGTRVVTDILVLRRRGEDEPPVPHNWLNVLNVLNPPGEGPQVWANEYFSSHSHHILGRLDVRHGQFGPEVDVTDGPEDLAGAVRKAFVDIARTARERGLAPTPARDFTPITVPSAELGRQEGLLQIAKDGAITKMGRGVALPHTVWPAKDEAELRQLIGLRDTYTALLNAEAATAEDTDEMAQLRAELNRRYDSYVEQFGPINRFKYNAAGNKHYPYQGQFRQDPMCSVVYALERFDSETQTASKASVFTRRVLVPRRPAESADSPADALAMCLDIHGRVDLDEIARLLKAPSAEAAREALGTLVFNDPEAPEHDQVVAAAEYLSGDVRRKLRTAQGLVATHPHLQANIEALEAVVPADLTSDQIDAKLGASWIDRSYVEQFVRELLDDENVIVENPGGGVWAVRGPESNPEATQTWGTDVFNAYELLTLTLNQKRVVVMRTVGEGKDKRTVLDQEATETARGKVEELRMRFSEWVWEDPERAEHLQELYNDTFNGIALRSYDDVRLTLPGLDKNFTPRPHQYAAVARILNEPATLLAHPVGAGKTAEMVMGAMEMRRLGLAKKPVVVVPNHMLEQVSREWLQIYPQARLLVADGKKMQPAYRADFVAQCANGDWDAVVMTHSQFERLPMSRAKQAEYVQRRVDELQEWINSSDASHDRITVKRLQRMLANAEERLQRHLEKSDPGLCFEQTGIDALIVDEAHRFKNGQINSNIQEAAKEASGRADDMLMKTDFIHEQGGRIVFATATPIANSVFEAWMIMRYLRPDLLAERGLLESDVWASTFGEVRPVIERNVDGDIREKDRFASFDNLPELLRLFHSFADIKTAEALHLPVPEVGYVDPNNPENFIEGPQTLVVPHTPEQWSAQLAIQSQARSITGKNPGEHLVVRNHARYNALHRNLAPDPPDLADLSPEDVQRAIASIEEFNRLSAEEREQRMKEYYSLLQTNSGEGEETPEWFRDLSLGATKNDFAAHNIARIWEANKDTVYDEAERPGALQMVFCDLGTPLDEQKMKKSSRTFSVYEDLRDKLIARGIPPEEIRFIQETSGDDRKKAELFAACRDGRVSVLIGSTEMMGVGTNVQKRAVALHHLDCPWRPVDIEQREGRIKRQGNLNARVQIYRYVTPNSFDTVLWDTNVRKAMFIAQVMAGQLTTRSIEDISSEISSFALTQAIAANNPLEQKLAENHKKLSRLEKRHRGFVRSRAASEHTIRHAPARIHAVETAILRLENAVAQRVPTRGDAFKMVVDGHTYESRADAGKALRELLLSSRSQTLALANNGEMTPVGSAHVGGFGLTVSLKAKRRMDGNVVTAGLIEFVDLPDEKGATSTSYILLRSTQEIREFSPHGLVTKLTNRVEALDERLRNAREQLPKEHKKLSTAQANLERAFPWEQELIEARELDSALRAELGMAARDEDTEVSVAAVGAGTAEASAPKSSPKATAMSKTSVGLSDAETSAPERPAEPAPPAQDQTPPTTTNEVLLQAARERGFLMVGAIGPDNAATAGTSPQSAAERSEAASSTSLSDAATSAPERPAEPAPRAQDQTPPATTNRSEPEKARLNHDEGPEVQAMATPVSADVSQEPNTPHQDTAAVVDLEPDEIQALGYVVATGRSYPVLYRPTDDGRAHTRATPDTLAQLAHDLLMVEEDPFGLPVMPDWPQFVRGPNHELAYLAGVQGLGEESFVAFTRDADGLVTIPFGFDALQAEGRDVHPLPPVNSSAYEQAFRHLGDRLPDPTNYGSTRATESVIELAHETLNDYRDSEVTQGPERLQQIDELISCSARLIEVGAVAQCERILDLAHQAAAHPGEAAVWDRQQWALRTACITTAELVPATPQHRHTATVLKAAHALALEQIQHTHPDFHMDPGRRARDFQYVPVGSASMPWFHEPHRALAAVEDAGLRVEAKRLLQMALDQAPTQAERDHWEAQLSYPYAPMRRRALIHQALQAAHHQKKRPDVPAVAERATETRNYVVQELQATIRAYHDISEPFEPWAEDALQLHEVLRRIDPAAAQGLEPNLQPIRQAHRGLVLAPAWAEAKAAAGEETTFIEDRASEVMVSVRRLRDRGEMRVAVEAIDAYNQHLENIGLQPKLETLRRDLMTQASSLGNHLAEEGRAAHKAGDYQHELELVRQVWRSYPLAPVDQVTEAIAKLEDSIAASAQPPSAPPTEPAAEKEKDTEHVPSLQASPPELPPVEPVDLTDDISDDVSLLGRLTQAQQRLRSGVVSSGAHLNEAQGTGEADLVAARGLVVSAIEARLGSSDRAGAWRLLGAAQVIDPPSVNRFTDDDDLLLDLARHLVAEGPLDTEQARTALERADQELRDYHVLGTPVENRRPEKVVSVLLDQGLYRHAERFLELAAPTPTRLGLERERILNAWTQPLYAHHQDTVLPALLGETGIDTDLVAQARAALGRTYRPYRYRESDINREERAQFNDAITRLWLGDPPGRAMALALITQANHVDPAGYWDRAELYSRLRYTPEAFPDGLPDGLVRIEHGEDGTRLFGVPRAAKGSALNEALTSAKFKYTTREGGYWYLPRPWKVWTRQGRVNQLLNSLDNLNVAYITQARWQAFHDGQASAQDLHRRKEFRAALEAAQNMDAPGGATIAFRAMRAYVVREQAEQAVHNRRDTFGLTKGLYDRAHLQAKTKSEVAKARYQRAKASGAEPRVLLELAEEFANLHPQPDKVADLTPLLESLRTQVAQEMPAAAGGIDRALEVEAAHLATPERAPVSPVTVESVAPVPGAETTETAKSPESGPQTPALAVEAQVEGPEEERPRRAETAVSELNKAIKAKSAAETPDRDSEMETSEHYVPAPDQPKAAGLMQHQSLVEKGEEEDVPAEEMEELTAIHPEEEAQRLTEEIARQELERRWEEQAEQMALNAPVESIPAGPTEGPAPTPATEGATPVESIPAGPTEGPAPTPATEGATPVESIPAGPTEGPAPTPATEGATPVESIPAGPTEGPAPTPEASTQEAVNAADAAFQRAGQARRVYQYRTALQELDRARKLDPSREDLWTWARAVVRADQASERAGHLMRQGKFQASLASLKEALRLDPSRAPLWEQRRNQVQQARAEYRPNSPSMVVYQRKNGKVQPDPPTSERPHVSTKPVPQQQRGARR
ncbi:DEAD/DEAH box helicase family protein [Marinactinospora thermotolerans]|uniref:DEAD/DEAH box helicase family protein n=1 Tax=Marinactinospora thermotolerans TaxID=531310 RepID=UPI003D8CF298